MTDEAASVQPMEPAQPTQPVTSAQPVEPAQPTQPTQPAEPVVPSSQPGGEGPGAAYPSYNSSTEMLNQACRDVFKDPGIVKNSLLLGLINCVPILNFVATGYAMRWGRRAAFRVGDKLPSGYFGDREFVNGFFFVVAALVWSLIMILACFIPLAGWVAIILAVPFVTLSLSYLAVADNLGAAFRFGQIWNVGKRNYGGLWLLTLAPAAISILASALLGTLSTSLGGVDLTTLMLTDANYASTIMSLSAPTMIVTLVVEFAEAVVTVIVTLIQYRAMGYWIGRHGVEWVQEAVNSGKQPQ